MPPYTFEPIGIARSLFHDRVSAPRQPPLAGDAPGRIELIEGRGYEDALQGLAAWQHVWIVFVFNRNVEQARGWRPKVLPPRSEEKLGVFATRSPHRPNPIGLSAVAIDRVEGLVVHVRGLDLLDETPVLDLKPYVAYSDAHPDSRAGWLEAHDPIAPWEVVFTEVANRELDWLRGRGVDLRPAVVAALSLGPQPHAYRRIRPHEGAMRLSIKEWRIDFAAIGRRIEVRGVRSGFRARALASEPDLELHRMFEAQRR